MEILYLFILLFVFILIGTPLYIGILLSCLIYIFVRGDIEYGLITQQLYSGIDKYSLLAIPLYIFAGNLISRSVVGEKIVDFMKSIFAPLYGGTGIVTVLSSMFFSLISGSAPATVLTVGKLTQKAMINSGYSKPFSLGLIISTGSLGIVIPPSIFLIVYGVVTNTSIRDLFIYGAYAGFAFGAVFLVATIIYAWKNKLRSSEVFSLRDIIKSFKNSFLSLLLPFIVIFGISTGITTPTEAGVSVILYGMFLGFFVYKDLNFKAIGEIALASAKTTSQIMIIMAAASLLGWLLAESNDFNLIYAFFGQFESIIIPMILLNLLFLILGMVIDITSLAVILSTMLIAVSKIINVSLVDIGVIMAINGAVGMYTPPFGLSLFVAKDIGASSYQETIKLLVPFYLISLVALIFVNILVLKVI